jgi:hypothetical protein
MQKSIRHSSCSRSFFPGSFPRVLGSVMCHGLLHGSTYMSLVEVENTLHNVLVVGIFGTLLVRFLVQIHLYLIVHLCIHLNLLMVCCTGVPGYTTCVYTVVAHYCTGTAHCCIVVVLTWTKVQLVLSSFLHAPYEYLNFFLSSTPSFYNAYHHDPLIYRNCNMNFWVLFYTSASLDNDMDHAHVF